MRLISAKISNYRTHKQLAIEFDRQLTLIGGPNESGKSTLVEAIHRCLFLKARGNTQWHHSMRSLTHGGTPEVEITFEVRGETYTLIKRFSGANGSVRLVGPGGKTNMGDEAEAQLSELLSIEQTSRSNLQNQWAHLWVWQGSSFADPAAEAIAEHESLIQRLQDIGGAVALQTEIDSAVANHFKQENEATFTNRGEPRSGSELKNASDKVAEAMKRLETAESTLSKLRSAKIAFEQAEAMLARLAEDRKSLITETAENEKKLRELQSLREAEREQSARARQASEQYNALEAAEKRITETRVQIEERKRKLAPGQEELQQLEKQLQLAKTELKEKIAAAKAASDRSALAEARKDYHEAQDRRFDLQRQEAALAQRLQQIEKQELALSELEASIAALPRVSPDDVSKLRVEEGNLRAAKARLEGMSTEVEVLEAEEELQVDGAVFPVGSRRTFAETTELVYGSLRLRLKPGGGDSLQKARIAVEQAQERRNMLLGGMGVANLEEASKAATQRAELEIRLKHAKESLKGSAPQSTRQEWEDLRKRLEDLNTDLEQLAGKVPAEACPENAAAAQLALRHAREALTSARTEEQECRAEQEVAAKAITRLEAEVSAKRQELDEEKQLLAAGLSRLAVLEETHGDATSRLLALDAAKHDRDTAAGALKATLTKIESLQPEILEADKKRLSRAMEQNDTQTTQSREQRAAAHATLQLDGSTDPEADVELARAELAAARETQSRVLLRARSINLLAKLFDEEQMEVAEQFSAPLAQRVSGYLKAIYGAEANATLEVSKDCVSKIELRRDSSNGIAFEFGSLSMGAKEQLAAAVRLAIAEVLANCPKDCLPIVFDDAFTNSDPERIRALQRMLDYAASRGLQVIVLTCNPSDYSALGARTTILSPSAAQAISSVTQDISITSGVTGNAEPEVLLEVLESMGGQAGNQKLREALNWDEATYERVRDMLVSGGKLEKGRGRGGVVCLPDVSMN